MCGWVGSFLGVFSLSFILSGNALLADELAPMDACLLQQFRLADSSISLAELRNQCEIVISAREPEIESQDEVKPVPELVAQDPEPLGDMVAEEPRPAGESLISRRVQAEKSTRYNPFVLSPHKRNYVLLASYNDTPNYEIYNIPETNFDRVEMKFQLSFKMPVLEGVQGTDADLYVAYSNLSFWQAYNEKISSPFRETVHEPEMFLIIPNDWTIGGWRNSLLQIGAVHQSNGKSGFMSRSWNRVYANFIFEKEKFLIGFKPWHRVQESEDDNPDITDFLGHFETRAAYKWNRHVFSLMLRNNIESGFSRGALEFGWSFPIWKYPYLKGYFQWFNGYGESLIDYNEHNNSIGVGLLITDWL